MKKISTITAAVVLLALTTSCQKEYVCTCNNGAQNSIVEASSQSDAESECESKGSGCDLQA